MRSAHHHEPDLILYTNPQFAPTRSLAPVQFSHSLTLQISSLASAKKRKKA